MKIQDERTKDDSAEDGEKVLRDRIIDAAFCAFMQRGYSETSTIEIATLAKVSKRDLYRHFENKQALFAAGIASRTQRMRAPANLPEIHDRKTLAGTLMAWGNSVLREVTDPQVIAVHRLAIAEAHRAPEVAQTLHQVGREENVRAISALLRRAQTLNLIGAGDCNAMASGFFALLWGNLLIDLLLRVTARPTAKEIDRRAHAATQTFLSLYGCSEAAD